jgi:hypothetical protein
MGVKKVLILIACLIFASAGTAWSVQLDLYPTSITVDPCNLFNIELKVSGLGDYQAPSVGDFDIDILYNTSQMAFTGYTLGPYLGDVGLGEALDWSWGDPGGTGAVDLAEVSLLLGNVLDDPFGLWGPPYLDDLQPDEFILATLEFHCLRPGKSLIYIDPSDPWLTYKVGDAYGRPFQVTIGPPVEVTQTPEPCTLVLIGTGLAGARFLRRRLKK